MNLYLDMQMELTPEQIALREAAHKFSELVLRPAAKNLDLVDDPADIIAKDSELWGVFRQAYALGYHASGLPAEVGGMVASATELCGQFSCVS